MAMSGDELWRLTALETVTLLRNGEITPLELIDAAADRIAAVEPTVNALPILCLDRARDHARRLMAERRSAPASGYLFGLPIVVKDLTAVAGVRWTDGSRAYADRIAARSDILVERLEENGAIVIAKSNTPEFGAGGNTDNDVFGPTLNPWDTRCTCGGSSGGSAVALATGEAWGAVGSDMAGSIRIPSAFSSVVGLRPSPGRVAHGPRTLCYSTLNADGPMARTVPDAALLLDALVGEHIEDPLSLPHPGFSFLEAARAPKKPRRIAWSASLNLGPVDPEVRRVCETAVRSFEALGIAVEEAAPDLKDANRTFEVLRNMQRAGGKEVVRQHRDQLGHEIVHYTEKALRQTADEISTAEVARGRIYHELVSFFKQYDILATPTVLAPPFDVRVRHLMGCEGVEFTDYFAWLVLTYAITITACPAISVPCGFTASGLPVGLQLVGRLRDEAGVLSAAALFEQQHPFAAMTPIDPRVGTAPLPAVYGIREQGGAPRLA